MRPPGISLQVKIPEQSGRGVYFLYNHNNQLADMEESLSSLEEALRLTAPLSPEKPMHVGNLARRRRGICTDKSHCPRYH